jgi:hypothetical protein
MALPQLSPRRPRDHGCVGCRFARRAAAQVVIIQAASTGAAKVTSSVMPIVVAALVIAWNISSHTPSRRDARASSHHRRPAPGVMLAWPCRSRAGVLCDGVNAAMKPPRISHRSS